VISVGAEFAREFFPGGMIDEVVQRFVHGNNDPINEG
jgi:hypothetical protein